MKIFMSRLNFLRTGHLTCVFCKNCLSNFVVHVVNKLIFLFFFVFLTNTANVSQKKNKNKNKRKKTKTKQILLMFKSSSLDVKVFHTHKSA